jgi:predicted transposase YdaD
MPRHEFDKGSKYLVQQQGKGVLWLGGARDVRLCRALQAELVQPRRLPDGLLEVDFHGRDKPVRFLVEVATYPEKRVLQQALDDLTLAAAHFREPPELLIVVLRPKGRFRVPRRHERKSRLGWSALAGEWNVVELWEREADELLAAGDVGVVPWVPLTRFAGPPEDLLTRCRERIEQQAHRDDRANLLAVSQVMAGLRFPQEELLALLGGTQVMSESPVITKLLAKTGQEVIVEVLTARFGKVPHEIVQRLRAVVKEKDIKALARFAGTCPDLATFRERLPS